MMKLIQTATTLLHMMMISSFSQTVQAQKCSDVCPNEDRSDCWIDKVFIRDTCNSGVPIKSHHSNGGCNAWCWCNSFGRNCDPCGTCNRGLVDVTTLNDDDDYSEYMAYSDNEKMVELSDTVCPEGKVAASYDLHRALESLADTNGDGFLSRDEFEDAHHGTSDILNEHCVYINEVEDKSEENVVTITKALSFKEREPVNFAALRARGAKKEGEKCQFPFPNCGPRLTCARRKNKHPVCHPSNKCLPSGFYARSKAYHYKDICCSKSGSNGWCH